ncbi:MAG: ribbon-helix-helix protein, CopG family [Prochloraceae cyanobacterium]
MRPARKINSYSKFGGDTLKKRKPRKLQIRLSEEEYDQLEKLAAENLLSKSVLLRDKTLLAGFPIS